MNYEELMQGHADKLIDQLLVHVLAQEAVEIRFNFEDEDQWSIISMHQYEEDVEISLRMHLNDYYDLYLGYYDDEDEFHELTHALTEPERDQLPIGLKKVMKKVLDDEQGMRLSGNFLSR